MNQLTFEECELIGALLGDGHISTKSGKYIIGFTGNKETDKEYFVKLEDLISLAWKKKTKSKITENVIMLTFYSKQLVEHLTNELGLPANKGKCLRAKIPKQIYLDWALAKNTIRGLIDTDGSVFVSDKRGAPRYPSIEFTTTSKVLAIQVKKLLSRRGFRVANIWSYCSKLSKHTTYKVPLNGRGNLEKWIKEIGFSNPYKLERAINALC